MKKRVGFSEHKTLLNVLPAQFTNGVADTLSMELFFDTTSSHRDVREQYIEKIDMLIEVDGQLHGPPCAGSSGAGGSISNRDSSKRTSASRGSCPTGRPYAPGWT